MKKKIVVTQRKLEELENIQIINKGGTYFITFDCVIKDKLLNINHKLKCTSKGLIEAEIEENTTKPKDSSYFSNYDVHIKIDFQSLSTIDENGTDYLIKFEKS